MASPFAYVLVVTPMRVVIPRSTSGDASLAIFDLKQRRVEGRVTNQEDELLSIQLMKVRRAALVTSRNW